MAPEADIDPDQADDEDEDDDGLVEVGFCGNQITLF